MYTTYPPGRLYIHMENTRCEFCENQESDTALQDATKPAVERLQKICDGFVEYDDSKFTEKVNLVGAKVFFKPDVYRQPSSEEHAPASSQGKQLKNELTKAELGTKSDALLKVLEEWAKEKLCSVWISDTLSTDLNIPVLKGPPECVKLQAFVLGWQLPPVVVTLYEGQDSTADEAQDFTRRFVRELTSSLLDFCHLDFDILPCSVSSGDLTVGALREQVRLRLQRSRLYYDGPQFLTKAAYSEIKNAAMALVNASYAPCFLKEGVKQFRLLEPDWRDALFLTIELLLHGVDYHLIVNSRTAEKVQSAVLEAAVRISWTKEVLLRTSEADMEDRIRWIEEYSKERFSTPRNITVQDIYQDTPVRKTVIAVYYNGHEIDAPPILRDDCGEGAESAEQNTAEPPTSSKRETQKDPFCNLEHVKDLPFGRKVGSVWSFCAVNEETLLLINETTGKLIFVAVDTGERTKLKLESKPIRAAALQNGGVAVTCRPNKIVLVNANSDSVNPNPEETSTIHTARQYFGVAVDSRDNTLFVGSERESQVLACVDLLSLDGKVLQTVVDQHIRDLCRPSYLCRVGEDLLISDWSKRTVFRVKCDNNMPGRVVDKIAPKDLKEPRQVAADQSGNIYIAYPAAEDYKGCVLVKAFNGKTSRLELQDLKPKADIKSFFPRKPKKSRERETGHGPEQSRKSEDSHGPDERGKSTKSRRPEASHEPEQSRKPKNSRGPELHGICATNCRMFCLWRTETSVIVSVFDKVVST